MLKFTLLKHNNVSTIDLMGQMDFLVLVRLKTFLLYTLSIGMTVLRWSFSSAQHVVMINQPDHSKPTLIDFSQPDVIRPWGCKPMHLYITKRGKAYLIDHPLPAVDPSQGKNLFLIDRGSSQKLVSWDILGKERKNIKSVKLDFDSEKTRAKFVLKLTERIPIRDFETVFSWFDSTTSKKAWRLTMYDYDRRQLSPRFYDIHNQRDKELSVKIGRSNTWSHNEDWTNIFDIQRNRINFLKIIIKFSTWRKEIPISST